MKGIWTVKASNVRQLQFVKLSDFATVQDAVRGIEESQIDEVFVTAHVSGLPVEMVMGLSVEEFDARRGIITIRNRRSVEEVRSIVLATERLNLYRQHALDEARNSGWRGWATHLIMDTEEYEGSIVRFTVRSRDRFLEVWNSIQDYRSVIAHPVVVEHENSLIIDFLEIHGIPDDLRGNRYTLLRGIVVGERPVLLLYPGLI